MMGTRPATPVFRYNRLSAVFLGAASLFINTIACHLPSGNQKLKSGLQDALSDEINVYSGALAMLFDRVTNPYWHLLWRNCIFQILHS